MSPPDMAQLRALVARQFRVYDAQEDKIRGQVVARRFYIMYPPGEFDARFEAVRKDLKAVDPNLLAFLRRDGGEDILFVAERPPDKPQNITLRVVLLLATIVTTTIAGAFNWHTYWHGTRGLSSSLWSTFQTLWDNNEFLWGFLSFSLPLLLILGIHETAHYVVARRHGLRANLPMFIPAPVMLIGTFGAFISLKDTLPDRKALFDVGVSGPLAGFFVTLPVVLVGLSLTGTYQMEVPDIDRPLAAVEAAGEVHPFQDDGHGRATWTMEAPPAGILVVNITANRDLMGNDWHYTLRTVVSSGNGTEDADEVSGTLEAGRQALYTVKVPAGASSAHMTLTWAHGLMEFGEPLLVRGIKAAFNAQGSGDLDRYLTHPTYFAGWVGLLITGINLLPTGQLDGGHVSRAVFGENSRHVARIALFLLVFLALISMAWMLMALFVLLTGIYHPPPLNDRTPLDGKRRALAWFVLAVFILTFVPVPFQL